MSALEAARIGLALIGLVFTLISLVLALRSARLVDLEIRARRLTRDGPRWNYAAGMVIAMGLFIPGWVGFLAAGVILSLVPDNPLSPYGDTSNIVVLIAQLSFALGQGAITMVWFRVKKAMMRPILWLPKQVFPEDTRA